MNNVKPLRLVSQIKDLLDDIDSNLVYVLKELPRNALDAELRRQVTLICQAFHHTIEEKRGEVALATLILRFDSDVNSQDIPPPVTLLVRSICDGLNTYCFEIQTAVSLLRKASMMVGKSSMSTVIILVEESAANILISCSSFQEIFQSLVPNL